MYRRIHLRQWSITAKQAIRWQTLAPTGISGTSLIGAPSTEDPQLTSKVVFPCIEAGAFDESGLVARAAWITCGLSLMTRIEELEELISSSEDELDEDELDVSSLSESESGACCSLVTSGVWPGALGASFGATICNNWRSAGVISGARNGGSGRGCFAPLDGEVKGLQLVLMSTRMSLWRKRLGQTSSREYSCTDFLWCPCLAPCSKFKLSCPAAASKVDFILCVDRCFACSGVNNGGVSQLHWV